MAKQKIIIYDEFSMYARSAFANIAAMERSTDANRLLKDEVKLHSDSFSKLLSIMNERYFVLCRTESILVFYNAISKFDDFTNWKRMMPHFSSSRNKHAWVTFVVDTFYEKSITTALEANAGPKCRADSMAVMAI